MCEFKKGDKVICINTDNYEELVKDKVYEVEQPSGDFVYLKGCEYGYFTFLFRKECEYCNKGKHIKENIEDKIYLNIYGKHLRLIGKIFNIDFGRDILINYCPMCGRKLGG